MKHLFKTIYLNISFYSFFLAFSSAGIPVLTILVAATSLFSPQRRVMRYFRRAISFYGKVICYLAYPLIKVRHENNSGIKLQGPFIFVCNHRSTIDAFLMSVLPVEAVQVVNIWPFKIPVLGFYAKKAGYLNINVISYENFSMKAKELLRNNISIIFFPEGTRSKNKSMGHFRGAAFRLFLDCKVPIVPVCISGNEGVMKKGSLTMHPGTIRVRTLAPIYWEDYKDLNPYILKNMVRDIIQSELTLMDAI